MNPLYVEGNGETVYFTMSLWGPYDVYLAKVTLLSVPEPSSMAMFGVGLVGLGMASRRRATLACVNLNDSPDSEKTTVKTRPADDDLVSSGDRRFCRASPNPSLR